MANDAVNFGLSALLNLGAGAHGDDESEGGRDSSIGSSCSVLSFSKRSSRRVKKT